MKHETFAGAVLLVLAIYAVWTLLGRFNDDRCRFGGNGRGNGLVCTEHPPIVLPPDAKDLDRV